MNNPFKQRWFWITSLFAIINVTGLYFIVSAIENRQPGGLLTEIRQGFERISWPFLKVSKNTKALIENIGFTVQGVEPLADGGTQSSIVINFNKSVDLEEIKGYIDVTPETKFYLDSYYSGTKLVGDFKPGETYKISILKGMPAADSSSLMTGYENEVTIPDYAPTVNFKTPGIYMALKGEKNVLLESVNLEKIKFAVNKIYDNNIVYYLNQNGMPSDVGIDLVEKEIQLNAEHNKLTESTISLKDLVGSGRGLFYLTVKSSEDGEQYYPDDSKLILSTDIGILAKQSSHGLAVWLNSLSDTSAVVNASVKVFTQTNQLIAQGISDEKGMVILKDLDFSGDKKPFVITAATENDLSFLEIQKNVLSESDFDIQGRPYLSSGYEAFVYSDRGVYRPGEKVFMRLVLRASGITLPEQFPVTIVLKRPDGKEFKKLSGVLSDFGTLDLDVDIPDYAMTGVYEATAFVPGNDKSVGELKFNVEEFIPDNLKVAVKLASERYKLADIIPLMVKVQESFGAFAVGRNIELSYKLNPVKFEPKGYKDFTFADETIKYEPKSIDLDGKVSDEQGQGYFELQLPKELLVPSLLEASIKTVVRETGGRAVTNYATVKVDPYPFYIGVRKSKEGFGKTNEPVDFDLVTLLSDETEQVVPSLKVQVSKIIWNNVLKKDENGSYRYVTDSKEEVVEQNVVNMTTANGRYQFNPKDWGEYIIRVSGPASGNHSTAVKFYVSGPWDSQSWAMEKPERINLQFDHEKYNIGDTAKLLVQAPFKGKALIVCSTDSVVFSATMDLGAVSQEVEIPVTQEFSPNAYCSATVIRPLVYEENWSSHRAYGIAPLILDHKDHEYMVKVTAPEKVEPGNTLDLSVETAGEPAELSVAVVDDGILRLTDFKTPDPYGFFYSKRSNEILTADIYSLLVPEIKDKKVVSDSSPAGDRTVRKHTNPINAKRVKPVALWQSKIKTDANGKAVVQFKVPDFTGSLKYMVVAVGKSTFGNSEGLIKVTQPIIITVNLPRFLAMNDQFTVPVSVFNMTGKSGKIFVTLQATSGIENLGEIVTPVDVKDNSEGVVRFDLKAPKVPQKVVIKVTAMMGSVSVDRVVEIPVRPPIPWASLAGTGEVREGQTAVFKLPSGWVSTTGNAQLSIQALPSLKMLGGLKFLLQYPYGCIEQTTSTVFPLLYLNELAAQIDPKKFNAAGVRNIVTAGIERIISMQTLSGGFGWWPGSSDEYVWGSIYATDFLLEADRAGYPVPQMSQTGGLNYLEKVLSGKDSEYSLQEKSYAVYVLAKGGRIKASWIRRLQERMKDLPEYSRFHIAGALAIMGDRKMAEEILAKGMSDNPIDMETDGSLNSYTRQQALALTMYMDISPNSPFVPGLVKRLEEGMKDGRWATTQENGTALIALGKYARYLSLNEANLKGLVFVDGQKKYFFDSQNGFKVSDRVLVGKEITIEVTGTGSMYYTWLVDGVPAIDKVEEKDSGLSVRRVFLTKEGNPVDLNKVRQGDVLIADITVDPKAMANNLVIEDLLPAGFEVENPRLKTSEKLDGVDEESEAEEHMDIRDDRLVFFTNVNGVTHYKYVVRAVTRGDFILPAVRAELMYSPNIYSINGQGRVKIVE